MTLSVYVEREACWVADSTVPDRVFGIEASAAMVGNLLSRRTSHFSGCGVRGQAVDSSKEINPMSANTGGRHKERVSRRWVAG